MFVGFVTNMRYAGNFRGPSKFTACPYFPVQANLIFELLRTNGAVLKVPLHPPLSLKQCVDNGSEVKEVVLHAGRDRTEKAQMDCCSKTIHMNRSKTLLLKITIAKSCSSGQ